MPWARPTAGSIPGMLDACRAIQEWGGQIPAWGEGAQALEACGVSRPGLLAFDGTWPLPRAQAPPGYRPPAWFLASEKLRA